MAEDQAGKFLSGATEAEARKFDAAVMSWLDYRLSAYKEVKAIAAEAPDFAMAHIFKGLLLLSMGVAATIPAARSAAEQAATGPDSLTAREKKHLEALQAWCARDVSGACAYWDAVLTLAPKDKIGRASCRERVYAPV